MTRSSVFGASALLSGFRALSPALWIAGGAWCAAAAAPAAVTGHITLPSVSGAVPVRGGRLLLTTSGGAAALLDSPAARLESGKVLVSPAEHLEGSLRGRADVEDIQDAAWDGAAYAYLLGSHARTPEGDAPEARYRLARLRFDGSGKLLEARRSGAFLQALTANVPFLADSIRRTPARAGLNIEGLAWDPRGQLVFGLRAPTVTESVKRPHGGQEDAVVVRVLNPDALFSGGGQETALGEVVKLDLQGQGIRGMSYDPKRKAFWMVAGLSPAPTHPVRSPWAVWLWDGSGPPREAVLPHGLDLEQPAALCLIQTPAGERLLLIDPGRPESRYALIPVPELK